ncbi:MAG TPA: FAD-dependent oxidoreductase [Longimicrobium sp.]
MDTSVAVIGGGPAGLAAAHALVKGGARVVVFEAEAGVGGRTRTDVVDGYRIDAGAQLFGTHYRRVISLLGEVGAGGEMVRAPGRDALWRKGRAHEVVYGSPTSMLASGALPLGLKMRLGAQYLPYLQRHSSALDMDALERAADAGMDGESAAAWGERELARDFVDLLAHPLLATLYGTASEEASAGFYHALSRQGLTLQVLAMNGGAGGFCHALAGAVRRGGGEVRTGVEVRALARVEGGVEVDGARFGAAVVAVPAPAALGLLGDALPAASEWLRGVRVRPTATVALLLDRPVPGRFFGLSFPRGETRVVAAACAEENKGAALVPQGRGLLLVLPTPAAGESLFAASPDDALRAVLPELAHAIPTLSRTIRDVRVYPWRHGWTLFYPGYLARLRAARNGALEGGGPIALAGDYLYSPTVEGAVAAGLDAARRILTRP